jgi:branched-chain amino acid transport system substrate-binding protein
MRRTLRFVTSLLLVSALVGCGGASSASTSTKSPFVVYFIGDLTGPTAATGQPLSSGIKAFLDWTNKQGGVNGHRINLTTLDDASDVQKVKIGVQQASGAGALVIVGAASSNAWSPNAPFVQQTQIPVLGTGFTDPQIDPPQPYLYGIAPSFQDQSNILLNFLSQQLIKTGAVTASPKIAFYHYTSTAVTTMTGLYRQIMQSRGYPAVVADQSFAQNPTDVSAQAAAVAQAKPDVVIANMLDSNGPLAVKALREKGFTGPIVDSTGASAPATFQALKDTNYYSLRYVLSTNETEEPGISTIVSHAKAVGDTQNIDNNYFSTGWAMAAVAVAGMRKCGDSCTAVRMNSALERVGKVDTNGVNPTVGLSASSHRGINNGIEFRWDTTKGRELPVGGWIDGTKS